MNWMFEPRSKDYHYDDDSEGGTYWMYMNWYDFLLSPLIAVLFLFLFAIFVEIFIPLFIVANDFYSTVKRISESGELEFPGLVFTGIVIAIILSILISNRSFDVSEHPFITFCSSVFVLLFTLAPLTGLIWRLIKQK